MSRREALRLGGAALAGAAAISPADAIAKLSGRCPKGHLHCAGRCCPSGEVCLPPKHKGGKHSCGCPHRTHRCGSKCIDLNNDPHNCGKCGHRCGAGQHCASGQCICSAGMTSCNGGCVNTSADPTNCGACGHNCQSGEVCDAGQCASQCASGKTECNGTCVDLKNDANNCGACGTKCCNFFAASSCQSGTCHIDSCSPDWVNCSGNPLDGCNCLGTDCATAMCETSPCQ